MRRMIKIAVTAALLSVSIGSANAATYLFNLSGSRNASFALDLGKGPDEASSGFVGERIGFNHVAGTYGGTKGFADINFGTFLLASLNITGTPLGFTQFAGPELFTGTASAPTFKLGTFKLTSIVSGNSTLTISQANSAVPEPATWALALVGFGTLGAALRVRRTKQVYA